KSFFDPKIRCNHNNDHERESLQHSDLLKKLFHFAANGVELNRQGRVALKLPNIGGRSRIAAFAQHRQRLALVVAGFDHALQGRERLAMAKTPQRLGSSEAPLDAETV